MRLRGFHRLAWEWSRYKARVNKQRFAREIAEGSPGFVRWTKASGSLDLEIISFCGAADFPELILSMLTLVRHVGVPRQWTVYSDGTLGADQQRILKAMPFPARISPWDAALPASSSAAPALLRYAKAHPLGKKYVAVSHHVSNRAVMYADSDVLFYPQSRTLIPEACGQTSSLFIPDIPGAAALDQGLPAQWVDGPHQVNSGLMILRPGFQWAAGHDYIAGKDGRWGYFTEQTAIHISMLTNGAQPLDSARFVVSVRDQFDWAGGFRIEELAARHYVQMVRHLIWSSGWERHLAAGKEYGDNA